MSLIVTTNKATYEIFEAVINNNVPGLVLKDQGKTWLIETTDGSTGGFLEQPRNWQTQAILSFFGKGMSGTLIVMNLLKAAIPDIQWDIE